MNNYDRERSGQYMTGPSEGMSPEEWQKKHEQNLALEKDYTPDQEQAISESRTEGGMNAERAHTEARTVQARHGDRIALFDVRATLADVSGDDSEAVQKIKAEKNDFIEKTADAERRLVDAVLNSARQQIPQLKDSTVRKDFPLSNALGRGSVIEGPDIGPLEMQHIAGRLNTEVQSIVEPDPTSNDQDRVKKYDVVPVGKAGSRNFYLSWGNGNEYDGKPRLIALTDSAMKDAGLTVEKNTEWRSIYPEAGAEADQEQSKDQAAAA